jgi:DNA-binding LacI/PurR family transcriptional regulator
VETGNDAAGLARTAGNQADASRPATIRDVAAAAGVGRQTVSNVLNDSGRVGPEARARVLDAIAALDYQPHEGARSLRSQRTHQVAYVMPRDQLEPANLIMQQFLQALAAAGARRRYRVLIVVPDGDPRAEIRRLIGSRSVDAFVLSALEPDDRRVALLAEAGVPFACFGRTGQAQPQRWVDIDNRKATALTVEHVVAGGRTGIAYVGYRSDSIWDTDRRAGFEDGLASCGITPGEAEVLLVDDASASRRIRSLLTTSRPGAVVTGSDRLASVVYGVAGDLGVRVGRDLAVTGFDGSVIADLLRPQLTTVVIPVEAIARQVLDRALRFATGPDDRPGEVVPARLRVGESTRYRRGPGTGAGAAASAEPAGATDHPLDEDAVREENDGARPWKRFHGELARPRGEVLPTSRRVTIADVAAVAGVGVGTVSRVLNGSAHVRAATVSAVHEAIDTLGYRPSHAAAALVRGTPRTVAVIVTHLTRPSAVARVTGALAVLEQQGYDTILCNVDSPAERDRHLAALLPTHRVDGMLAISLPLGPEQLTQFRRAGVTLVTVDCVAPGAPQTVIDDVAAGRMATEHLIGLGHERIGFVGDHVPAPPVGLGFTSSIDRLRGYQQALAAAGLRPGPGLVRRGSHDAAAAADLAAELLKLAEAPSAIVAASDTQAIGVLAAADRLGVGVPGELSVVGFDDIESAALLGLSTIRQPLARSGADGARRLCALLRGERISPLRQELPVELVVRGSSGPPDPEARRSTEST